MKKLLLLTALAASFATANAEGFGDYFQLSHEGEAIADGATVTVTEYWNPIVREYPELAGTALDEGKMYCEAVIKATNITEEPVVMNFSLKVVSPEGGDFSTGSALGVLQLCYDFESAAGNCLAVKDGLLDYLPEIDPVSSEEYIQMRIEQNNFTEIDTPVSLQLDMRVMDDDAVVATSTIYINFDHKYDTTAAVDGIEAETSSEYFTLQGVRVAEPQKGQILIERKGGKATKRIF